jgi:hypothetical protein
LLILINYVIQYDPTYDPQYIEDPNGAAAGTSTSSAVPQPESPEKTRGRKRTRTQVGLSSSWLFFSIIDELFRLFLLPQLQAWW